MKIETKVETKRIETKSFTFTPEEAKILRATMANISLNYVANRLKMDVGVVDACVMEFYKTLDTIK